MLVNVASFLRCLQVLQQGWEHWLLPSYRSLGGRIEALTNRSFKLEGQRYATSGGCGIASFNLSNVCGIGRWRCRTSIDPLDAEDRDGKILRMTGSSSVVCFALNSPSLVKEVAFSIWSSTSSLS